jgi:hypothetical protein
MDTKFLEEYQDQVREWQKKFFDTWVENFPKGKLEVNFSDNFEKVVQFQEEVVKAYLESQEKTTQMMLESQKQFWNNYFELMRKKPTVNVN